MSLFLMMLIVSQLHFVTSGQWTSVELADITDYSDANPDEMYPVDMANQPSDESMPPDNPLKQVSGEHVVLGDAPFMAILKFRSMPFCLGSIVHRSWVATTWRCIGRSQQQASSFKSGEGIAMIDLTSAYHLRRKGVHIRLIQKVEFQKLEKEVEGARVMGAGTSGSMYSQIVMCMLEYPFFFPQKTYVLDFPRRAEFYGLPVECPLYGLMGDVMEDTATDLIEAKFMIPLQETISTDATVQVIDCAEPERPKCFLSAGAALVCNRTLIAISGVELTYGTAFCSGLRDRKMRMVQVGHVGQWMETLIQQSSKSSRLQKSFIVLLLISVVTFASSL